MSRSTQRAGERAPQPVHDLRRWLVLALPALVFAAALVPFWSSLGFGYLDLDDDRNLLAQFNPSFNAQNHSLSGATLEWMFTANHYGHYQPLTWVSYAVDAALAGRFEPQVFHRTNVLLHGLNTLLVYLLALALLRAARGDDYPHTGRLRWVAACAALLHGLHPLRAESVAWITERRDLLSAAFLLGAVLAYLRAVRSPGARGSWLALTGLLYVLSLFSKAWGITLPAVLLVLDAWPLRRTHGPDARSWGWLLREKLVFLPVALAFAWLAARAQGDILAVVPLAEHGLLARCVQAAWGLSFYLQKTLWPSGLSPLYLLEESFDVTRPRYLIGVATTILLCASAWLARRRLPAWTAAWCAYAILVSPVLGFLQSGAQVAADRYTYLAAIPLALCAGGALLFALESERLAARGAQVALGAALALLLAGLGVLAARQTLVWRDSTALFARVVEVEPDNYFGRHCYSVMLHRAGRMEEAEQHARASIAVHPRKGNVDARYNLALILQKTGRVAEVEAVAREALAVDGKHLPSLKLLISERLRAQDPQGALTAVEEHLQREPGFLEAYAELAQLAALNGRPDRALDGWRRALKFDPYFPPANHALGVAALESGNAAQAEALFVRALGHTVADPEILVDLARAYQAQGKLDQARACVQQALLIAPNHARAQALRAAL
jgi:protein O-mannosyl-transferase